MNTSKNKFFYLAVLPALAFQVIATYLYLGPYNGQPIGQVIYTINKTILILWPISWVYFSKTKGWPFLKGKIKKSLLQGTLFGIIIIAIVIGLYFGFYDFWYKFLPNLLTAVESLTFLKNNYIIFAFLLSLFHSFLEEYFWRWFILNGLMIKFKKWTAAIISALAFAMHHFIVISLLVPLELSLTFSFAIFLTALIWTAIYFKTKSLYGPWLSHFCADAIVMGIGYIMIQGI